MWINIFGSVGVEMYLYLVLVLVEGLLVTRKVCLKSRWELRLPLVGFQGIKVLIRIVPKFFFPKIPLVH